LVPSKAAKNTNVLLFATDVDDPEIALAAALTVVREVSGGVLVVIGGCPYH
jgi:hypothetical protein